MISNYLKIALRNLRRNKLYSFINVSGLSLGIACASLLTLYVVDELSFDRLHENADNMYRVVLSDRSDPNDVQYYGQCSAPLGPAIVETFPQFSEAVRLWQYQGQLVFVQDGQRLSERGWYMAEQNFFAHFNFPFIHGDPKRALERPKSIVLTESTAIKYFGTTDVIGRMVNQVSMGDLEVTGVLEDLPTNSHLQFDILISPSREDDDWTEYLQAFDNFGAYTYLIGNGQEMRADLDGALQEFLDQGLGERGEDFDLLLQPVTDIHFYSDHIRYGTDENKGEVRYIWIFNAIALFIILIASINYINLSTAKATQRGKEIGLRKVSGAQRAQLIGQFMSESVVIALLSFLIAIGLVDILLPSFNTIAGKSFSLQGQGFWNLVMVQLAITIVVGIVSGIYPSLYLSGLKPSLTVQGRSGRFGGKSPLRQTLVITQFALSIFMVISTLVIYKQLRYVEGYDMGFDQEELVIVDINNSNVRQRFEAVRTEFEKHPDVLAAAASSRVPGEWKNITEIFAKTGFLGEDSLLSYYMSFDEKVIPLYEFNMVQGANFDGNPGLDSTHLILNERAARLLRLPDQPIGERVRITARDIETEYTVVGIVEDFHFQSLHQEIAPLIIGYWNNPNRVIDYFSVRISGNARKPAIAHLTAVHEQFDEFSPIEFHFLDSQIDLFYQSERRAGNIFVFGAGLTIFIACLGLFGLASFTVSRRIKEIGIRKVLGASVRGLYVMISTSFLRQVLMAWIIAVPASYLVMSKWLEAFTYKVTIDGVIFLVAGSLAGLVALITVSYRSIVASLTNPAHTLRHE